MPPKHPNNLLLEQRITGMLMGMGYRFPKQAAKNVGEYRSIDLNLKTALKQGCTTRNYILQEEYFLSEERRL